MSWIVENSVEKDLQGINTALHPLVLDPLVMGYQKLSHDFEPCTNIATPAPILGRLRRLRYQAWHIVPIFRNRFRLKWNHSETIPLNLLNLNNSSIVFLYFSYKLHLLANCKPSCRGRICEDMLKLGRIPNANHPDSFKKLWSSTKFGTPSKQAFKFHREPDR